MVWLLLQLFRWIPCQNAKRMEPFVIGSDIFIAIANYANEFGNIQTYSTIYKLDVHRSAFLLSQKIKTTGAIDVKYFNIDMSSNERQHFLVFANSAENSKKNKQRVEDRKLFQLHVLNKLILENSYAAYEFICIILLQ